MDLLDKLQICPAKRCLKMKKKKKLSGFKFFFLFCIILSEKKVKVLHIF